MIGSEPADKAIRFGCGATVGAGVGMLFALQAVWVTWGGVAVAGLLGALLCGWLAMRYGERFWDAFLRWGPWI